MYNCLVTYLPFIKPLISDFFQTYIGIDINLESISLLSENAFDLNLKNIEADPQMLNSLALKNSNLKITSFTIGEIKIGISLNSVTVKISKIKLLLMPILTSSKEKQNEQISLNQQQIKNKKEPVHTKKEKNSNNSSNSSNKANGGGFKNALLNFIFKGINVEITDIDVYMLNYETNSVNMMLTNPCLSIHLPCIKFCVDKECNENEIQNFYDGKMFIIENIMVNISKSFIERKEINILADNKIDTIETYETIFALNPEKGICFYTKLENNFKLDIGDMQVLLNMFQIDLLKNFAENYISYFNNDEVKQNSKHKPKNHKTQTNNEKISSNDNNGFPFCANITFNSFSIILLESFYSEEKHKYYNYNPEQFKDHFCYFEDNFFIFSIKNITSKITSKTFPFKNIIIDFCLEEINLSYIEYKSKSIKISELIAPRGSIYSEPTGELLIESDITFKQVLSERNALSLQEINKWKYEHVDNNIFTLSTFRLKYDLKKSKLLSELDLIEIRIHPAYLFKVLKIIYDNSIFIKEILFYNKDKINETNIHGSLYETTVYKQELKLGSPEAKKQKENKLKYFEDEGEEVKTDIDDFEIIDSDESLNKNKENEFKIDVEFLLKKINIKLYCFKPEKAFSSTITPFFTEFYYDCIYILQMNQTKKMELKTITSNDSLSLSIKNIKLNVINTTENINIDIEDINLYFCVYQLFCIQNGIHIKIENNIKNIQIEAGLIIKAEMNIMDEILAFMNIWMYSMKILNIFQKRMEINFIKGNKEIYLMYNGHKKPKPKSKIKEIKIEKDNIQKKGNEMNIKLIIPIIDIELKYMKQNKDICGFGKFPHIKIKDINLNVNLLPNGDIKLLFMLDSIKGEEITFGILNIKVSFEMSKKIIEKIFNKKDSILESQLKNKNNFDLPKKRSHRIIFNSVNPEKDLNQYIIKINELNKQLEFEEKEYEQILQKYKEKQSTHKTIMCINVSASIKTIFVEPIEIVVFAHNIFNSFLQNKFDKNTFYQENDNLYTNSRSNPSSSQISLDSKDETLLQIESNQIKGSKIMKESNITMNKEEDEENSQKSSLDLNFGFELNKIQVIIGKAPFLCLEIQNIYADSSIKASIDLIAISIKYYKEKNEITAYLFKIANTSLQLNRSLLSGQISNFGTINLEINEIKAGICRDSFLYILDFVDKLKKVLKKISFETPHISPKQKRFNSFDIIENENKSNIESNIKHNSTNNLGHSTVLQFDSKNLQQVQTLPKTHKNNISTFISDNNYIGSDNTYKGEKLYQSLKITPKLKNKILLKVKNISISLYEGEDLTSKLKMSDEIQTILHGFQDINDSSFYYSTSRNESNRLSLQIEDISIQFMIELKTAYQLEYTMKNFLIEDTLQESDFKYIFNRSDISNDNLKPFLKIEVKIYNSMNNLSTSVYNDFNVECFIEITSFTIMLHQKTLYFIMDLFLGSKKEKEELEKIEKQKLQLTNNGILINGDEFFSKNNSDPIKECSFLKSRPNLEYDIMDAFVFGFEEITKLDNVNETNDKVKKEEKKKEPDFIFITKFLIKDFNVYFTYQSNDIGFKYGNLTIPIPCIDNYPYYFKQINFKGFSTLDNFISFLIKEIIAQISKYQLVVDFFKNLSFTKPISTMISNFFFIFISPYQSYKEGKGVLTGLKGGLTEFTLSVVRGNVFIGTKMLKTVMSFVGLSKSSKIDKESFYMRYFESEENKRYNEYFYKGSK